MAGSLRNTANRIRTASQIRRANRQAVGGARKRCKKGKNCSAACIQAGMVCLVGLPEPVEQSVSGVRKMLQGRIGKMPAPSPMTRDRLAPSQQDRAVAGQAKGILREMRPARLPQPAGPAPSTPGDYSKWNPVAEGNYGKVSVSPDGTRAVKELLVGKDGKKGEFGEFEVELAKKMGELGHSPRIYKATDKALEMDVAPGKPLWKDYQRGEDEPAMNAAQATKAATAIRDLHKMGYAHGDMHSQQFLVDGNNVKLVDYGLSVPIERQPVRAMQDLAKISSLVKWNNPELANDPYVQVVNKHLPAYREIKGTSKAAKAEKERIAQEYLRDVKALPGRSPQGKTEAQKAGAEAKKARQQERIDKSFDRARKGLEASLTGKKYEGPAPPSLQPLRGDASQATPKAAMATKVSEAKPATGNWTQKFTDRGPVVAQAQAKLESTIGKLPPAERPQWDEMANKQLAIRLNSSRNKTPLPPEEVDARLAKQMNAITRLIDGGKPSVVYDRIGQPIEGVKLKPVITATGHAKWMNEENGRIFSLNTKSGQWVQAKPAGEDTGRRLADMEKIVKRDGKKWALHNDENFQQQRHQKGDPKDDRVYTTDKVTGERRKKTVDEVEAEISGKRGLPQKILRNGLDQSGNEGLALNPYYDNNPAELRARYREAIQGWLDQGGLSLATGKPIALPGREATSGEERSTIDHFTPISTYRGKNLSAQELRRVVDNGKNFNIVEESFNSQRGADPWLGWANRVIEAGGVGSAKPPKAKKAPAAQKKKDDAL